MANEVEIVVTSKDKTGKGFQSAEKGASKLGGVLGKVGDIAGKAGAGVGKAGGVVGLALGVVGGAAIGAGLKVVDMAGKLELMGKKSQIVFGDQLGSVETWAKTNANAMGLTKREAVGLAAGFADLLIPMGFTRKEAAGMAQDTIGLSGALAEWSNGALTAAEVSDVLSAAYLGERDGLQALGISISQAEVDAALLAKGQENLTGKQLQQAEATATQELIFAKSKDAQTAYANGADSLARKTTESKARMKEMGQTLLVTVTPALMKIGDAVSKYVLPKLEQFVTWISGPGKYVMAEWALAGTESVLAFADKMLGSLDTLLEGIQNWGKWTLRTMAATFAVFNPTLAKSMLDASNKIDSWAESSRESIQKARDKLGSWNTDVAKMKTEVKLKADKADLDTKLAAAKTALADPKLTATKKAALTATIKSLQEQVNAAQRKIDSLHGKTVNVTLNTYKNLIETKISGGDLIRTRATGGPVSGLATGGTRSSGQFVVGERGPELLSLSGGTGHVTPAGNTRRQLGQASGPSSVVLEIKSGGSRMDDLLVELLRKAVKRRGGGDVQAVLGS